MERGYCPTIRWRRPECDLSQPSEKKKKIKDFRFRASPRPTLYLRFTEPYI